MIWYWAPFCNGSVNYGRFEGICPRSRREEIFQTGPFGLFVSVCFWCVLHGQKNTVVCYFSKTFLKKIRRLAFTCGKSKSNLCPRWHLHMAAFVQPEVWRRLIYCHKWWRMQANVFISESWSSKWLAFLAWLKR